MNDTSATSQSGASITPENVGAINLTFLVIMVLVAALAIAMIIAGARRKHTRKKADHELAERAEQAGVEPPSPNAIPIDESEQELEQAKLVRAEAPTEPAKSSEPSRNPAPLDPAPLNDEPIAAAAPMDASPAVEAAGAPERGGPADGPITQLKGVGPKLATRLEELGFITVGQIAALTDAEADQLDAQLGPFSGRIARDRWIEQARFLAAGDRAGFEAVFGRL